MARTRCTDRVVGAILASWRYDISGISPEMRKDYEQHFAECQHCRARQQFQEKVGARLREELGIGAGPPLRQAERNAANSP